MKFHRLIRLLVLRNIVQEKFLTALSIIGVALGIGLFIGVKVASDRAAASFESGIRGITPSANYEILDVSGIDFDELIYGDLLRRAEQAFPIITARTFIGTLNETLEISGIDTVKSLPFLKIDPGHASEIEAFYKTINGVVVTRKLSDKYGLKKGTILMASVYDKERPLKIVDILELESLPAHTAIMDIGNFQDYFGKQGSLSRIELATDQETAGEIAGILPGNLSIERKEVLIENQKALLASFRYNLQFVSLIAILVGMFLLYNTVFISVIKRRTEIGILRGLGAGSRTVLLLFTAQGLILGTVGSVVGIALGQLTAFFSVIAVEKTISAMYSTVSLSDYLITPSDGARSLLIGIIISLAASLIPSYEASKIRPHESSREGSFEGRYRRYLKVFSGIGVALVFSGAIISYFEYLQAPFEFPYLSYAGILLIILGFTCIAPFYLILLLRLIKGPFEKTFRAMGKITVGDMQGSLYRFSIALMSVAISCSLIVALLTLIFSFRESLKDWIAHTIAADVYIKPSSCTSNFCVEPLSNEMVSMVESLPEVAGIDRYRVLKIDLFGRKVLAGFGNTEVTRRLAGTQYFERYNEARLKELEQSEQVAVSEYLAMKHGLKAGDSIEVQTPGGKRRFIINGTFMSYSTTAGFIYFDRKWLTKYWGLDDSTQMSVYLKKGYDSEKFIEKLKQSLRPTYSLEIMNNGELRRKILAIFDRSFAITYAIEVIAIVVSLIGMINTLLALVLEKKREISIFRYLGGSWGQMRFKLLLSSAVVGAAGTLLGLAMGPLISMIFVHVINRISFGWEVHLRMPFFSLSLVTMLLFLTALLAGIIPSAMARRIDPKRFISFE